MVNKIGFIGLGIMGLPMAKNLIKSGFDLLVFNRTPSRTKEIEQLGARVAFSPKEIAQNSDVVITIVTDSKDVEDVVLGQDGVIHGAWSGMTLIDMSTISPSVTRTVAGKLQECGADMLDAPVSGGESGAINGTLAIMVGGESSVFERCLPVLQGMGQRIVHVGANGSGQTVKLVNQILVAGTLNAVCEALVFAKRSGLDLEAALEVVKGGAAASWQLENLAPKIMEGDFSPGFMVKLVQKDLRLILEAASELQVSLPGTSMISQFYRAVEAAGEGDLGTQALVKVFERLSGIEARI